MIKEKLINHIKYNLEINADVFLTDEDAKMVIEALKQEPCGDAISRQSLKSKLKENHDFFVNAYGGFSNLSQNDKARVDEITNCIAMVVNEPPVTPQPKIGCKGCIYEKTGNNSTYPCSHCGRCYTDKYKAKSEDIEPQERENKEKLSWLGKNCKDCGNEKCKKLGTLPRGYSCALWQEKRN